MSDQVLETTCCVAGGGPAGIMLGYLLARQGVQVTVLEKHGDFLRDFRGDTVHPSTLDVLAELGLLHDFLKLPHQKVDSVGVVLGDSLLPVADFRHVPARCKFVALMPQWDFLKFLSERAKRFPAFDLRMQHEAVDLVRDRDQVTGLIALGPQRQQVEIRADLVIGCDGRHSVVRRAAHLPLNESGVPIDVLWFRLSWQEGDPEQVLGNVNYGKALILIARSDYFQAGLIIPKGGYEEIQRRGLTDLKNTVRNIAPFLNGRVEELQSWDQIQVLTVQINRLTRWFRPGLLCIGDAAHAMSPAGGVGINLAIQDAVAAANLLAQALRQRRVNVADLAAVQNRREFPTHVTQAVQVFIHKQFARVFQNPGPIKAPWQAKAVLQIPGIHRALGYAVGMGVRPEHVRDAKRPTTAGPSLIGSLARVVVGVTVGVAAAVATFRQLERI